MLGVDVNIVSSNVYIVGRQLYSFEIVEQFPCFDVVVPRMQGAFDHFSVYLSGSKRTILAALILWTLVVSVAFFLPVRQVVPFLVLACAIGIVLGGSQALSRSLFSLLIPRGKEGEYFSLYQAAERGTSWFGTLAFGLVFQLTGSYRNAILVLIMFFVVGFVLLSRVDVQRGIEKAGNEVPAVLRT